MGNRGPLRIFIPNPENANSADIILPDGTNLTEIASIASISLKTTANSVRAIIEIDNVIVEPGLAPPEYRRFGRTEQKPVISVAQIQAKAYELWQADGSPDYGSLGYWAEAERQLDGERSHMQQDRQREALTG